MIQHAIRQECKARKKANKAELAMKKYNLPI